MLTTQGIGEMVGMYRESVPCAQDRDSEGFRKAEFSGKVLEKLVPNQRWEEEEELAG